jgi:hypothetical protein
VRVFSPNIKPIALVSFLPLVVSVASDLDRPSSRVETLVGRSVAMFIHPCAAWRSRSSAMRVRLFVAYILTGYVLSLGLLLLWSA